MFRPKRLACWYEDLHCSVQAIHCRRADRVAPIINVSTIIARFWIVDYDLPPLRRIDLIQCEDEEDGERAYRQPSVQSAGRKVVQATPPAEVPPADDVLEDVAHDSPREVVEWCRWWDLATSAKNDGCQRVLEHAARPLLLDAPDDERQGGTEGEAEEQRGVHLAGREQALWTEQTPDDGGGEEDFCAGAGELLRLSRLANVLDIFEREIEHEDLHHSGKDCGNGLSHEHCSWRNLHVVATARTISIVWHFRLGATHNFMSPTKPSA